jgi:type IV secretion system protein VirB9
MLKHAFSGVAIAACLLASSTYVSAAAVPTGTLYDSRIQTVHYNPDDVIVVHTKTGYMTLIQFDKGEFIPNASEGVGGLGMGDKAAWSLGVRGNNVFLKPTAMLPDTNLTVVTNKRTYNFMLVTAKRDKDVTWTLRFVYPQPAKPAETLVQAKPAPCGDGPKNLNYFKWGNNDLAPTEAWDDGRFTCFRFPSSKALPTIYRVTPNGDEKEALVNFHIQDDFVVVHDIAKEYRLRDGKQVLGIKTDSLRYAPYNFKNTTVPNQKRVLNDAIEE